MSRAALKAITDWVSSPTNPSEIGVPFALKYALVAAITLALPPLPISEATASTIYPISRLHLDMPAPASGTLSGAFTSRSSILPWVMYEVTRIPRVSIEVCTLPQTAGLVFDPYEGSGVIVRSL